MQITGRSDPVILTKANTFNATKKIDLTIDEKQLNESVYDSRGWRRALSISYGASKKWLNQQENKGLKLALIILVGCVVTMFWYLNAQFKEFQQLSQVNTNSCNILNKLNNINRAGTRVRELIFTSDISNLIRVRERTAVRAVMAKTESYTRPKRSAKDSYALARSLSTLKRFSAKAVTEPLSTSKIFLQMHFVCSLLNIKTHIIVY